jgi:hypothetical protein
MLILSASTGGAAQTDAQGSPDISLYTPDGEVTPGTESELTIQVSNAGDFTRGDPADRQVVTTARGTRIKLTDTDVPFEVETEERSIGAVTVGEPNNVDFDITVPDGAAPGSYTLPVELEYTYTAKAVAGQPNQANVQEEKSRTIQTTVDVQISDDPRFKISEIDDSLRVGEEGEITGQLRNVGADDARSVEVTFAPGSDTVRPTTEQVAVDNIPAGESARFSIPVEVTTEADAVSREFDLPVTYRNADTGIRGEDDDPSFRVDIGESRDTFIIEPVNPTVAAGSTKSLDLRVTNNRDETLEDIEGKLFVDDPLDSSNDETFTTALEPNETTTVTVDLSAGGDATIKTYPVSMDFRYTDSDGDSKLSDSYRTAISVTEPTDDGGGLPIGPLLLVLLVVAGAGAFLWRRNDGGIDDIGGLQDE